MGIFRISITYTAQQNYSRKKLVEKEDFTNDREFIGTWSEPSDQPAKPYCN
jgi:hypothetical protein